MKIALFGGAFDPPHLGHQRVAEEVTSLGIVDQVWYVPVFIHPWEQRLGKTHMAPYNHRKQMVQLMLPLQTELKEYRDVSYTYPTLVHFAQKYPQHQFSWLMGSEYLSRFADFLTEHPRLIEFSFYIYPRAGFPMEPLLDNMVSLSELAEVDISSTKVKQQLRLGVDISELVNPKVAAYIHQHQLYQSE